MQIALGVLLIVAFLALVVAAVRWLGGSGQRASRSGKDMDALDYRTSTKDEHLRPWYGFVVPWIGFALLWADFGPSWGLEGTYLRRLGVGLVGGFLAAGLTYLINHRVLALLFRWMERRSKVPPAA